MLARVLTAGALTALLVGFLAAPHEHVHRSDGTRHAHLPPHPHSHNDDAAAPDANHEDDADEIASTSSDFVFQPVVRIVVQAPAALTPETVYVDAAGADRAVQTDDPRVHGPPRISRRSPRAPPSHPAA